MDLNATNIILKHANEMRLFGWDSEYLYPGLDKIAKLTTPE